MCKNNICFIGISQYCSDPIFVHQSQPDGYVSFGWIRIGKFCHLWCEFHLELRVRSNVFSVSYQKDLVLSQNIICGLFFRLHEQFISPIISFKDFSFRFSVFFGIQFFCPFFRSFSCLRISVFISVWSSFSPRLSTAGSQNVFCWCSGWFAWSSYVCGQIRITFGLIRRVAMSTGLTNLDCSGVTKENLAIFAFTLII